MLLFSRVFLDCATRENAERNLQSDSATAADLLLVEITPWYTASIRSFKPRNPKKLN